MEKERKPATYTNSICVYVCVLAVIYFCALAKLLDYSALRLASLYLWAGYSALWQILVTKPTNVQLLACIAILHCMHI